MNRSKVERVRTTKTADGADKNFDSAVWRYIVNCWIDMPSEMGRITQFLPIMWVILT